MRRCAVILALAVTTVWAEDATTAPAQDPLAAAKKEYAQIKSAGTDSNSQQQLKVPQQALGGLNLKEESDPGEPSPWTSPKDGADRKKKRMKNSENWLVDAMTKKDQPRSKDGIKLPVDDSNESADNDVQQGDFMANAQALQEEKDAKQDRTREIAADKKAAGEIPNPLASYMADWMTSKDFELLKPAAIGAGEAASEGFFSAAGIPQGPSPAEVKPGGGNINPDALRDAVPALSPKGNPYLADLNNAILPPPNLPAPPIEEMTTGLASLLPVPPAPPPVPEAQPEAKINPVQAALQKQQDDEKYFKQLNRF